MSLRWCCCAAALLASCSFPDVDIVPVGGANATGPVGGDGGAGGVTNAGGNTSSTGGEGGEACVNFDGDVNMDGDPFYETQPGCCEVNVDCDCDDMNGEINPDNEEYSDMPRLGQTGQAEFDYNCDGVSEPEFMEGNCSQLLCGQPGELLGVFEGPDYSCGAMGTVRYCTGANACVPYKDPMPLKCR